MQWKIWPVGGGLLSESGTFISVFILTVEFFVNNIRVDWIFYEFYYGVVTGTYIRVFILTVDFV